MRFRAQAVSLEIELMLACQGNLEIESMLVFPVSREIAWTRVYRASPEIESMLVFPVSREIAWTRVYRANPETVWIVAGRGSQTSVDPDVLATTYKIFQAELPTEGS